MPVNLKVNFNKAEIAAKITGACSAAVEKTAYEILADSNKYAPVRNAVLIGNRVDKADEQPRVDIFPNEGRAVVSWNVPYARKMYHGKTKSGKAIRYSKKPNPNAQSKWFEKAKSLKLSDWRKFFETVLKEEMENGTN